MGSGRFPTAVPRESSGGDGDSLPHSLQNKSGDKPGQNGWSTVEMEEEQWSRWKELGARALDKGASDNTNAWLKKKAKMKKKKKKSQEEWMVGEKGLVVVDKVDIVHNPAAGYHESVGVNVGQSGVEAVKRILRQPAGGVH